MSFQQKFPNLQSTGYSITSPWGRKYNCIGLAAHDQGRWWWPNPSYYWPDSVPFQETVQAFIQAFSTLGYEECENSELEPGFEKVVIYIDSDNIPTHAARQLPSGLWTSKLGSNIDIEHTIEGLIGPGYGNIGPILKRQIPS